MAVKYLFIGGPADGRRIEIDCGGGVEPPYMSIPVVPKDSLLNLTAEEFARIDGILGREITIHRYKKETLSERGAKTYAVYVSDEVENLVHQLLIGYRRERK